MAAVLKRSEMRVGDVLFEQMMAQAVKQLMQALTDQRSPQWVYDFLVNRYGSVMLRYSRHNFTQQKVTAFVQAKQGLGHPLAQPAGIQWLKEIEAKLSELEE